MRVAELIEKFSRLKYLAGDIEVVIDHDDIRYDEFELEVHHGDDDLIVICPIILDEAPAAMPGNE